MFPENTFWGKRQRMIQQFLDSWFWLGGFISADTYKRPMGADDEIFSEAPAAYHETLRRKINEEGANDRFIMAGHEWMLRQCFGRPLKRSDVELAMDWYTNESAVRAFPVGPFTKLLEETDGEDIYLPVDVWGFPGGQTFFKGVPALSVEGPGVFASVVEAQTCRYFEPVIHATKGRLLFEAAGPLWAEFGYRSDLSEVEAIARLLAIYVGSGGNGKTKPILTSMDGAEFMFPHLFKAIGTIGHEFVCSRQTFDKGLDEAEYEAMEAFVVNNPHAALLGDLVDFWTVGMNNIIRVMKNHPEMPDLAARLDTEEELAVQAIEAWNRMQAEGLGRRRIIPESSVRPEVIREVRRKFEAATGVSSQGILIPGVGGWFNLDLHRDTVSAAFKRSQTGNNPNMKFSRGKGSIPGTIRVYERVLRGKITMVIADRSEVIDGMPLFVKLVDQGRIVNVEDMDFEAQAYRANDTWDLYDGVEYSPLITSWMERFTQMRDEAIARARQT